MGLISSRGLLPWLTVMICFQDMIHIADTKVARRYGDFFIRQIHKFDDVSMQFTVTFWGDLV